MADSDSVVRIVIALLANTIPSADKTPAFPTTTSNRRNMMTPRIVNTQGVKTPANVPKRFPSCTGNTWLMWLGYGG